MAHKRILFRSEACERILCRAARLGDAVRITPGPKSRSVLNQRCWEVPMVCDDWVTIAREFDLADHDNEVVAIVPDNAASVASVILLSETTMTGPPEPKGEQAGLSGEP